MTTPTQRTLAALRKQGRPCEVVERWIDYHRKPGQSGPLGIRKDLFGIIDIIALDHERGVVGVQCCAGSGYSAHWKKITQEYAENTKQFLMTPGTALELWAWRKIKKVRGGKAMVWEARVTEITIEAMEG